jgi:hypothetical protein
MEEQLKEDIALTQEEWSKEELMEEELLKQEVLFVEGFPWIAESPSAGQFDQKEAVVLIPVALSKLEEWTRQVEALNQVSNWMEESELESAYRLN